ncbi:hypothetical protein ACQUWY_23370, partial [Ralstonia pseudosolanacearum]
VVVHHRHARQSGELLAHRPHRDAGGVGNGAVGGAGGAGGAVAVDAGTFNMSNAMTSVGQSAAGVMVANQNSGFASLVQQSINVQANLNVGK